MTVLSAQTIVRQGLVSPCREGYLHTLTGLSGGLGPAGHDVALAQDVTLYPAGEEGCFVLASAQERFNLPPDVLAIVHDKSSWARRGLAVQNTVLEPGWRGYLTLELTNHSTGIIRLYAGTPVAQVVFHRLDEPTSRPYRGRYQDQEPGPQEAR